MRFASRYGLKEPDESRTPVEHFTVNGQRRGVRVDAGGHGHLKLRHTLQS